MLCLNVASGKTNKTQNKQTKPPKNQNQTKTTNKQIHQDIGMYKGRIEGNGKENIKMYISK